MQKVLAVIPARSGSKSIKDKNIRLLNGMPMLAYSIKHALASKKIDRVIVSTDSEIYARIAKQYGAEVPFIRPASISTDTSLDIEVFQHVLEYLNNEEMYNPDIIVHLRPTYPIRNVQDIDNMIDMMINDETIDSVRCVAPAKELAYKMWRMDENQKITPLGVPVGAALARMARGEKLPIQGVNIIEDWGYTSVWEEVSYQAKSMYQLPELLSLYGVSVLSKRTAGFAYG
ncbi:cytidylyltransferase domain-containing protein, partial [Streptococcus hyovaginalis]